MNYLRSSYRMELFLANLVRVVLALSLLAIFFMVQGCSNSINTRGTASRDAIRQTGQLCLGLKADSESCTSTTGGTDEKSDRTPMLPAS